MAFSHVRSTIYRIRAFTAMTKLDRFCYNENIMNEVERFSGAAGMNIETAKSEIEAMRQEIYMIGANDSEFSEIATILKALKDGTYSPEKAIEETRKIYEKKMDYH